jgi:uncharacterized protein YabN with tetrapyrrole methylase and pyrophosphatase domain
VADSPDQVATNWEAQKLVEKGRASVTEGIPKAMPALALAAKLQRKALTVGLELPGEAAEAEAIVAGLDRLLSGTAGEPQPAVGSGRGAAPSDGESDQGSTHQEARSRTETQVAELLFSVVSVARQLGVDPETALRARSVAFRQQVAEHEHDASAS